MGYSISWYAVREESAPQFLEQLGLVPGTETEDFPESLISTAKLQTGWRILWYGKYDCPFLGSDKLASISENFDVLACLVEEHVMASSAEYWSRGERSWWISHQGEDGPKGLDFGGALLPIFFIMIFLGFPLPIAPPPETKVKQEQSVPVKRKKKKDS
jgi:hypothetical protein